MDTEVLVVDGKEHTIVRDPLRGVAVSESGNLYPFSRLDIEAGRIGCLPKDGNEKIISIVPAQGYYLSLGNGVQVGLMVDGMLRDAQTGRPATVVDLIRRYASNGHGHSGKNPALGFRTFVTGGSGRDHRGLKKKAAIEVVESRSAVTPAMKRKRGRPRKNAD